MIFVVITWFAVGFYATLRNKERSYRMHGPCPGLDFVQNLLTLILGPVGLILVITHGGTFK